MVDGFAAANFALGGVLLFRLLPAIVLGPLAGAFADRFDRRKTMVVSDILRFALFASIPLVDNLVWLFIAQFLIEAISLFWIPAKEAAVPNMLRKDQMEPANQLSLVTTYGLTPVAAAIAFSLLTSAGVVIATAPASSASPGGGDAAYGLLFGAVFIGLGLGIGLGPSIARDRARERLFGVAIVGAGVALLALTLSFTLWISLLVVV